MFNSNFRISSESSAGRKHILRNIKNDDIDAAAYLWIESKPTDPETVSAHSHATDVLEKHCGLSRPTAKKIKEQTIIIVAKCLALFSVVRTMDFRWKAYVVCQCRLAAD